MDGILPTEDFMEEELLSLTHEHKVQSHIVKVICKMEIVY